MQQAHPHHYPHINVLQVKPLPCVRRKATATDGAENDKHYYPEIPKTRNPSMNEIKSPTSIQRKALTKVNGHSAGEALSTPES